MALVHHHLILRAGINNPPKQAKYMKQWLLNLVDKIGMKVLMGPYSVYSKMEGNRGLTAAVIIETSHCVVHTWDEEYPGMFQLDLYSCAPFDVDTILDLIDEFGIIWYDAKVFDREYKVELQKSLNYNIEGKTTLWQKVKEKLSHTLTKSTK